MDPTQPHDPFAQFDEPRTFIKPNPGGRSAVRMPESSRQEPIAAADLQLTDDGLNPLVALANRLLLLVPQLRATRRVDDPEALRNQLAQGIREFAAQAASAGITQDRVNAARYVLCTMIDEAAADSPWGGSGLWAQHSLLTMFHNENWGGEKVFQLMARLAEKPEANLDLLELIYCALVLGFEGRYRVIDNGAAQLEAVRDKLAQIIKQQRGDYPAALAQHWPVQATTQRRALTWLPLAAVSALAALLVVGAYFVLTVSLSGMSDPVYANIQGLRLTPPVPATIAPAPSPRLAQFLQSDVKAGAVAVRDEIDRSVVTLRGDGLFAPASATLMPEREALMGRIADALTQLPGPVLITGHTDSQRIQSVRFPSNWHLSEERAKSVRDLLIAHKVAPDRIRAEGRADGEPLVANDTAANRAMNRRVEITLLIGRANEAAPKPAAAAPASAPNRP